MKSLSLKHQKEPLVIAIFLGLCLLYKLFGSIDFTLTNYTKLYISQATQDGVDIGKRLTFFYRIIAASIIIRPLFYFGIFKIAKRFSLNSKSLTIPGISSLTGIILIISHLMGVNSHKGIEFFFILTLISFFGAILSNRIKSLRFLGNESIFGGLLTIALILTTGVILIFNSSSQIPKNINAWYFTTVILLLIVATLIHKKGIRFGIIFRYAFPLAFIPLVLFISVESFFYFRINQHSDFNYKVLFLSLLLIIYTIFLFYRRRKIWSLSFHKLFSYYLVPAALFSFILLAFYLPIMQQPQELFEFANPAVSQMRIFGYGEIPFVDFMSSHMFSEEFYGLIYNLLFGYNAFLDFYVYNFIYLLIFYGIAYLFMLRLTHSPLLSLLILLAFPFTLGLFSLHLFYGVMLFHSVKYLLDKQTAFAYFGL